MSEEFQNATINSHKGFAFEEDSGRKITIIVTSSFSQSPHSKCFPSNHVPRVLSLPRESTLVTAGAGHVSMHANRSRTEGGS